VVSQWAPSTLDGSEEQKKKWVPAMARFEKIGCFGLTEPLGGGPGGIEHFFQQFTGPMTAWCKTLGSPMLTPEVQKKLIDCVHDEVGARTIEQLEAERDQVLLGLLELRLRAEHAVAAQGPTRT